MSAKARALGEAVPGRHLQMYFRDKALQDVVVEKKLAGTIPERRTGNLSAVYTQNGNASKMDVFQHRTVCEVVRLRRDGSARVRRTVELENDSPRYVGLLPDRGFGYDTRWSTALITNLMPTGARVTEEPVVELSSTVHQGVDQDGRTYAQAAVIMKPSATMTATWEYVVPRAAVVRGDVMHFRD